MTHAIPCMCPWCGHATVSGRPKLITCEKCLRTFERPLTEAAQRIIDARKAGTPIADIPGAHSYKCRVLKDAGLTRTNRPRVVAAPKPRVALKINDPFGRV